jgi:hypothetical protein
MVGDACIGSEAGKKGSLKVEFVLASGLVVVWHANLFALPVSEAVCGMVIDHAGRLHVRVHDS